MSEEMPENWQAYYDLQAEEALPMWTIYRPPVEGFDGKVWVARLWANLPEAQPQGAVYTAATLEALRDKLPPGLVYLTRSPGEDPTIQEVWL